MADNLKSTQLARINVPAITDVKYAESMADAFDKINDNFKKIASLPFLQGVQGDSYQLEEYKIWNDNWAITEDGKILLNSIFGKDVTKGGNSFNSIRKYIGEELDGVSPIDFFKQGNTIINNSLYFYVIKDDTGNVIEKQLGQFYYFIDERLKKMGESYNNENVTSILSGFNDYTGFYQYKNDSYTRLEILPSIYYDQDKNDICWQFNGIKTGISSIGVSGENGKDAQFSIVKVTADMTNVSGKVEAEFKYDKSNNIGMWDSDPANLDKIKDSKAIICCYYQDYKIDDTDISVIGEKPTIKDLPSYGNKKGDGWFVQGVLFAWDGSNWTMVPQGLNFAYGELVRGDDGVLCAYWNHGSMMSHVMNNLKINSYFYDMGESQNASAPHYLAIPTVVKRGSSEKDQQKAHTIKTDGENLVFENTTDALTSPGQQKAIPTPETSNKEVKLNNYNLRVYDATNKSNNAYIESNKITLTASGKSSTFGHTTNINENLTVGNNLSVGTQLTVGKSGGKKYPDLQYATNLFGKLNLFEGVLFINPTNSKYKDTEGNSLIIHDGNLKLRGGNIGASGNIETTAGSIISKNNITATNGNLTVGGIGSIKGQTLTLGTNATEGRSTTIIKNTGSKDKDGRIRSNFSLDVNSLESGHKRYFTINSTSPVYEKDGTSNYNTARITLGSPIGQSNIKENYIQICAGEDGVFSNTGARAGIQIHAGADGSSGDVTIKPNLTVQGRTTIKSGPNIIADIDKGSATINVNTTIKGGIKFSGGPNNTSSIEIPSDGGVKIKGLTDVDGGLNVKNGTATFEGDVNVTNNKTTTTNGNLVILGANPTYTNDASSDFNTLLNSVDKGQILIGATKKADGTHRMFLNRASIQTYSYATGTNKYTGSTFHINPCGGPVSIGGSISAKSNLTVSGSITGESGIKVSGGVSGNASEFYSGPGATTDRNILKVNSEAVTVEGGIGLLKVKDRVVVNSIGTYAISNGGAKQGGGYYGLEDLIGGKESNIHCGGNSNVGGTDTAYRTVYNRSALQAYKQKLNGGAQSYEGSTFFINPNGGPVHIGRNVSGKTSSLTVNGTAIITEKTTINSGGLDIKSGGATISGRTTINSGGLDIKSGGATIKGGIKFSGGQSDTSSIEIPSDGGVKIKGLTDVDGGLNISTGNLVIPGASPADQSPGPSSIDKDTSSNLNTLLESGNNGQLLIGATKNNNSGTNRMFLNRASIQTYTRSSNKYTGTNLYLNPGGGNVIIGNTDSATSNLNVYGRIYARGIAGYASAEGARIIGGTGATGASGATGGNGLVIYGGTGGTNTDYSKLPGTGGNGLAVWGGAGGENTNQTSGKEADGVTGGAGAYIYGGAGGKNGAQSTVSGNGGYGLVVYGGNAYQNPSNSSGSGGYGLVVYGGKNYNGNRSSLALKANGNIYIGDTSGGNVTTLSSNKSGFKINNTTTIDGGLNVNNGVINANKGLTVSGGNVNINSTNKLLIGNLNSNETAVNSGIEIDYSSGNTSSIKFRGKNINDSNYSNQMVITTNADTTNKYTVGRLYMDNNFNKQFIQIFTGYSGTNPIYGNSKAGIQILHDEGNSASDCVSIKPKLTVDGGLTVSSGGASITGSLSAETFIMPSVKYNTDTSNGASEYGAQETRQLLSGGIISGADKRIAWNIQSAPEGAIIIVTGGVGPGWRTNLSSKSANGNYVTNGPNAYESLTGGIYRIAKAKSSTDDSYHKEFYLLCSPYVGKQEYLHKETVG